MKNTKSFIFWLTDNKGISVQDALKYCIRNGLNPNTKNFSNLKFSKKLEDFIIENLELYFKRHELLNKRFML